MKKVAKSIRVITVAPIVAFVLINLLYFKGNNVFNNIWGYFIALFTLVILPLLAYPVQRILLPSKDKRQAERTLAIIFSICGYVIGLVFALIFNTSSVQKIMFLTYLLSGSLIALFSFGLKIKASGHMCGLAGPIALIVYVFGYYYLLLVFLLILVIWSSLKLRRHNLIELTIGSIIPIVALLISIMIFK